MFTEQLTDICLPDSQVSGMDLEVTYQGIFLSEFTIDFAAGLLGGCAGLAFGQPFDTVKVRQQTSTGGRLGMFKCIKSTFLKEGPRGFFKGMAFPLAAVGIQNSIFFGVYGNTIRLLSEEGADLDHPSYKSIFLAGAFAGAVQGLVAAPSDLIKVKLQSQTDVGNTRYSGPIHCVQSIYSQHGIKGCFRGITATTLREIPGLSVYITSYFWMRDKMCAPEGGDHFTVPRMLLAGGIAGILSWMVNIPVDIVKSRMQADDISNPRYKNTLDCFVKSYQNDGWRVFWRGLPVTCLRAFPTNAVTFAVYSTFLQYMQQIREADDAYY